MFFTNKYPVQPAKKRKDKNINNKAMCQPTKIRISNTITAKIVEIICPASMPPTKPLALIPTTSLFIIYSSIKKTMHNVSHYLLNSNTFVFWI